MIQGSWDFIELLTEEEARQVAAPHLKTLRACIEDAFAAVEKEEKERADFYRVYPTGARATIIFWQVVNRAEVAFRDEDGVTISYNRGFLTVLIADKLEIRFKKFRRGFRSSNYPTSHQRFYQLQLRLKGMEEPTRATAGYRLKPDGTLGEIALVCRKGDVLEWVIELPMDVDGTIRHPLADVPAAGEKPKVRPKKA